MATLIIPNVFVNGTVADADPVNQNFNAVQAQVNNIDSNNIGSAGIWASHIKQSTQAEGTFGNTEYRFQQRTAGKVPLTIHSTQAAPGSDIFDVIDSTGTTRVWIDEDYVLHAGDVDFTGGSITGLYASHIVPTTAAQATFGGSEGYKFLQRDAGEVPLTLEAHASPTGDLLNVKDSAGTKMLWIGSGFAVHMSKALNCSQILLTEQGYLDFGDNGQITTYPAGLGMRMFGACAYDWTSGTLFAKSTSAAIWHVSSGSRPFAAYFANPTTAGAAITNMTEVFYLNQYGSIQITSPNTTAPYIAIGGTTQALSPFNMGLIPGGGFYMAFGAYYFQPLNSWIATAGSAAIMIWGYSPTFSGFTLLQTFDSGLTIGNGFTPTFINGVGMGASNMNAIIAQAGIQLRAGVGVSAGNGAVLWGGNQNPPPNTQGNNGDYYFCTSNPGQANARIFVKNNSGVWTGIV